jgi:hypothetical protein
MKEGVTTTMKRKKSKGWPHPSMGYCPFSYIYVGHAPLLHTLSYFPSPTLLLQTIAVA